MYYFIQFYATESDITVVFVFDLLSKQSIVLQTGFFLSQNAVEVVHPDHVHNVFCTQFYSNETVKCS